MPTDERNEVPSSSRVGLADALAPFFWHERGAADLASGLTTVDADDARELHRRHDLAAILGTAVYLAALEGNVTRVDVIAGEAWSCTERRRFVFDMIKRAKDRVERGEASPADQGVLVHTALRAISPDFDRIDTAKVIERIGSRRSAKAEAAAMIAHARVWGANLDNAAERKRLGSAVDRTPGEPERVAKERLRLLMTMHAFSRSFAALSGATKPNENLLHEAAVSTSAIALALLVGDAERVRVERVAQASLPMEERRAMAGEVTRQHAARYQADPEDRVLERWRLELLMVDPNFAMPTSDIDWAQLLREAAKETASTGPSAALAKLTMATGALDRASASVLRAAYSEWLTRWRSSMPQ